MGKTRMLAIGGEEGGVRIMNIDEGIGRHREAKGLWWRAHSNAIFDIKWSGDDSRIVRSLGLSYPMLAGQR
jgi:denticleless